MYAKRRGWDLEDVRVYVDFDNRATPRTADVLVEVSGALSDDQFERLEKVAAACPVRRTLEAGAVVNERVVRDGEPVLVG
jgi:uncharacterized OsmC-like protein